VEEDFTVRLFREPRALDRFRHWELTVDGNTEGSIVPGETVVLAFEPRSSHTVRVGGRWQTSHERQVKGGAGAVFELVCRPRRPTLMTWMPFGIGSNFKHDLYFVHRTDKPKQRSES